MLTLLRYFRSIHPLSETLRDRLEDALKEKKLARKDYLLKAGQIGGNIYFIEKGLLRCYYSKNGKDISSWFMKEGDFCFSPESFFSQQYGHEYIQALEDCILYYITYDDMQHIYRDFVEFNLIGRILMEKCYLLRWQRLHAMWMQPAEDRYNWLTKQFPELLQRVPAKYLASYIGITEVMLSIIKGRR